MATKYLIAGGNYSSDLIWSTSSGGANDTTHPTSADDVIANAASGAVTLTIDVNSEYKTFVCTGFTGTLAGSASLTGGNTTIVSGMTVTYTGTINCSGNFSGGGKDYGEVNITVGSGTTTISGDNTGSELNFIGSANKTGIVEFAGNQDFTTITSTPDSITNRLWFKSSVTGTARTLTADNVTIANTDFQDIVCAGSGTWSGTSIGNCGGNTGLTGTTPVTRYWIGNAGSFSDTAKWSASTGGAGGETVPLVHDTIKIDANSVTSGSQTLTFDMPRIGGIDMSAVANTPAVSTTLSGFYFFGDVILGNIIFTNINKYYIMYQRKDFSLSCPVTFPNFLIVQCETSKCTFMSNFVFNNGSDLTTDYSYNFYTGVIDYNDFDITLSKARQWKLVGTNDPSLKCGDGTITITGRDKDGDYTWRLRSGTIDYENSTFVFNNTSASYNKSVQGTHAFNELKFTGNGNPLCLLASNTFNEIEVDSSAGANTLTLAAGTTQTGKVTAHGSTGKKITINSSTPGSPAYLVDSSGSNNLQYVDLTDIQVSGGADWTYDFNSTYNTGNSGWRANSNEFNFDAFKWNTESAYQ